MRLQPILLALCFSTVAHAQAVAPAPASPPAFPTPRYTPAGAGAPVVGQPGQQAPPPTPRSPNTRVLPPTPEPGLWAADELSAVKRRTVSPPDVDELLLAQPSPGAPEIPSCRQRILRASKASGREDMRHNLPRTVRACVTARLLNHCVHREYQDFNSSLDRTPQSKDVRELAARREREAIQTLLWQETLCESFRSLPVIESLITSVITELERQFEKQVTE